MPANTNGDSIMLSRRKLFPVAAALAAPGVLGLLARAWACSYA
jgi:hypothetical protein